MADSQRPQRGLRPGAPGGSASPRRAQPGRRPPPAKKGIPVQAYFIVIPLVLIAGLVVFQLFRESGGEKVVEKKVVDDPNVKIQNLEKQVDQFYSAFTEFRELSQKEAPTAKAKGEALAKRIDDWMEEWEAIFNPKRDPDGKLPKELQAYQQTRGRVQTLRSDLSRSMGFE